MKNSEWSKKTINCMKQNYPCYFFDANALYDNIESLRTFLEGKAQICYSVKSNPFLVKYAATAADCIEVCSFGELKLCKAVGVDETKIVVGGIYKSPEELEYIAENHYRCISVESQSELELLSKLASKYKNVQAVLLRMTSGNQFGMNKEDIINILRHEELYPYIHFCGIHYYSGTAKKNISNVKNDIGKIQQLMDAPGLRPLYVEYGPGIGFPSLIEKRDWFNSFLLEFKKIIIDFCQQYPITLEFGRLLASNIGCYVTKIVDIRVRDNIQFYIVRGGINHISYYGQINGNPTPYISYLETESKSDPVEVVICGELCTAHDILSLKSVINRGKVGDFLVFQNTGAYSVTEAKSLFLSHPLPAVLITDETGIHLARDARDTYPVNY